MDPKSAAQMLGFQLEEKGYLTPGRGRNERPDEQLAMTRRPIALPQAPEREQDWRKGFLLTILVMWLGTAHSDVYKYTDADGNVVFTDGPPANVDSEVVDLPSYDPPSKPALVGVPKQKSQSDLGLNRTEAQRIDNLAEEQLVAYDRRCTEARVALEVLHQGMPVYWVRDGEYRAAWSGDDYTGQRVYLSEAQRQAAIDGQLRKLAINCADPLNEAEQDKAAADWFNKEKCAAARAELAFRQQPSLRTSDEFLERKQQAVDESCGS